MDFYISNGNVHYVSPWEHFLYRRELANNDCLQIFFRLFHKCTWFRNIWRGFKITLFHISTAPCIGEALVPYYRNFLPILNLFRHRNVHKLDGIDYNRVGRLGDVIDQTLMMLERCGGPNAFINMKYAIPTYESCVDNWKHIKENWKALVALFAYFSKQIFNPQPADSNNLIEFYCILQFHNKK